MSNDKLKVLFHDKLYNHETEVQQSDWEIISERIKKKRRRKIIPLFYIYGTTGVAVALLIIMLLIKPDTANTNNEIISKSNTNTQTAHHEKNTETTTIDSQNKNIEKNNNITNTNQNQSVKIIANTNSIETSYNQNNEYNTETEYQYANSDINKSADKIETINYFPNTAIILEKVEELSPKTVIAEKTEDKRTIESTDNQENKQETANDEWWNQSETETAKEMNRHKWTMAFESGNNIGRSSVVSDFTNNKSNYNSIQSDYNGLPPIMSSTPIAAPESLKTEEPKTDINHRHPLNLGIRIKKNLSKRIVLKTGLSYSYFLSEFSDAERKIQQQIHYIGIPVGFEFLLFQKNNFNIYLSGEFAAEKGVSYIRRKSTIEMSDIPYYKPESGSVRGLQFSTNAGLGISYNFVKNIGIYVEPNTVYYISDDRQPQSFRTEKTFNFGLNIGLKYDF
ncbi:MAG: PorT family protein [Prevotellaceae bacterium]|jgi:hypothetical protein|nr:PorT family protein [Prevotellaceae bacterium]